MDENKPLTKKDLAAEKRPAPPAPPGMPKTVVHDLNHVGYRVFAVGMVAIFAIILIIGSIKMADMSDKISELNFQAEQGAIGMNEAVNKIVSLTEQKQALEEKLANLKNKEDLAKRDLEAYILKKFKTVPKVVAHEMAVQTVKQTKEAGVPFSLIVGLMEVESHFKPWAISKKGARGPMQVMPFWVKKQKELGIKLTSKYDLHDIDTGIKAGIAVFKYHLKESNNDINQGLYLYVGKDRTYANKVFNAMGRFEVFRSTLDTTLRAEENKEVSESEEEIIEEAPPAKKKVSLKRLTKSRKVSLKRLTFDKEAYARA